jgi:hypothetical protein
MCRDEQTQSDRQTAEARLISRAEETIDHTVISLPSPSEVWYFSPAMSMPNCVSVRLVVSANRDLFDALSL